MSGDLTREEALSLLECISGSSTPGPRFLDRGRLRGSQKCFTVIHVHARRLNEILAYAHLDGTDTKKSIAVSLPAE